MSAKRILLVAGGCLTFMCLLGGVVCLNNGLASGRTVYTQLQVLTEVLGIVTDNYVEKINGEDLVDGAIKGMLDQLDPHTNYLDPDRFKKMQERNRGMYFGIGVSFSIIGGDLTVISAIDGAPAAKLGIRAGDVIVKIDGETAKGIKEEEVFDKLRGERGTMVHVSVRRPGEKDLREYDIVRDEIPIYSVSAAFMLKPGIGYVGVNRFSATTSDELERALEKLESQGMQSLVFDLRGNAGGYLNEAIEVSDKFLPGGKKIVYTVGRIPDSNEEHFSTGRGQHTKFPIVVLLNHYSASASEIVSGALQDWDRALLIGETSFGKGLVQRQYQLKNGGALLLTVARYYTPSGRLIQRDYSNKERYLEETADDIDSEAKADTSHEKMPEFHTAGGRVVHGGGGITPDIKFVDDFKLSKLQMKLGTAYFDFANLYLGESKSTFSDLDSFRKDYAVSEDVTRKFENYLKEKKIEYQPDSLNAEMNDVKWGIKREMARNIWGDAGRWAVLLDNDPEIAVAIENLPKAETMARKEPTSGAGDWQNRH
jgi:carboxyl-terminal processing protease